jgi:predicted nucleic acid-binding protein
VIVTAVYDANVLYPSLLRDLLLRLAIGGCVRARWSAMILDEVFDNILANRPDLDPVLLARTRALMGEAVRDAEVDGFDHLIGRLDLPDDNDRHVLAAAIHGEAEVIVTFNLKDFPPGVLAAHGMIAQHPDEFLIDRLDDDRSTVIDAIDRISRSTSNPRRTADEIVDRLGASGLPMSAARLRTKRST